MGPRTVKGGLFFFLFLVIIFPFLEQCFSFIESGKLNGYTASNPDINFSYAKWWDGTYQRRKTDFLNDSVGFRPDLVRFNNQFDFYLFKRLHAEEVCIGKDGQLFTKVHTDEYFGVDHIGIDTVRTLLTKLKKIQDTLKHLGKTMVLAYAPSKAYYCPDKIPDYLCVIKGARTSNYHSFKRLGDSLGINQLDLNAYFLSMKDTTKNLIISKQGMHWTKYGALLGGDSLTKYIERIRHISMPELTIKEFIYSEKGLSLDAELGSILNLIFPIGVERYCYPDCDYSSKGGKNKPRAIFICDSYMWPLAADNYFSSTYTDWECWHYFNEVWNDDCVNGRQPLQHIPEYNWQQSLLGTDCLVILFTPYNLTNFAKKDFFLEVMYNYFYPNEKK